MPGPQAGLGMSLLSQLDLDSLPLFQQLGGIEIITAHQLFLMHQKNSISQSEIDNFDDKLGLAEAAIIGGDEHFFNNISDLLSDSEMAFIGYRRAQLENNFEIAQAKLKQCVEASRSSSLRDHEIEARARMEWGLLRYTQGQKEEAGVDLRWAMERLKAISEGSVQHGLSILNMASWHVSRNESMMALALLSQINRLGPHKIEIIASSRLQISKLLFELGDFFSSQRHAWVAFEGFSESGMIDEAIEASLIWIDLSLNDVTIDAPKMNHLVENSSPRDLGDDSKCSCHPDDMMSTINWCFENWQGDNSGVDRPDLIVLLEAERCLGISNFHDKFRNDDVIEDKEVITLLGC